MNVDPERSVLATILFSADDCECAFEQLEPDHFKKAELRGLFEDFQKMYAEGVAIDVVTASEKSTRDSLIMELSTEAYTAKHIKTHVNLVLDNYYKREAHRKLLGLAENLKKNNQPVKKLKEKVEELAAFLADRTTEKGLQTMEQVSVQVRNNLSSVSKGEVSGIKPGFKKLDELGFFFRKKTFNLIASRPRMGKSALALQIAKNAQVPTAFFSIEMGADEQYERLMSPIRRLSGDEFRQKDTVYHNSQKIKEAINKINKEKIWISEDRRITVPGIISQCRRLASEVDLGLVIVDYLGLIGAVGKVQNRREEITQISGMLKQGCSDLNLPIIALSQLNRECETRPDKRPILSDLRESGDLEQDAHMIWFLHRDHVYDKEADPTHAEILVAKNRGGRTGIVELEFNGKFTEFKDWDTSTPRYSGIEEGF